MKGVIGISVIAFTLTLFGICFTSINANAYSVANDSNEVIDEDFTIGLNKPLVPGSTEGYSISYSSIADKADLMDFKFTDNYDDEITSISIDNEGFKLNMIFKAKGSNTFKKGKHDGKYEHFCSINSYVQGCITNQYNVCGNYDSGSFDMEAEPTNAILVQVSLELQHTISTDNPDHGTVTSDVAFSGVGDTVTLTATPDAGYKFNKWIATPSDLAIGADGTFAMPDADVTVSAEFVPETNKINIDDTCEFGQITSDVTDAAPGDIVTLTATPDSGYLFNKWIVSPADLIINPDGTFIMPNEEVWISAEFVKAPAPEPSPDNPLIENISAVANQIIAQTGDFLVPIIAGCLALIALLGGFVLRRKYIKNN